MSDSISQVAAQARAAANVLALATRSTKDAALEAMAQALLDNVAAILTANATDVANAEANGTQPHMIDRLRLDESRIAGMAQGLREVAGLPDPVGTGVLRGGASFSATTGRSFSSVVRDGVAGRGVRRI